MPLSLADKYTRDDGRIYLTGVQALVRVMMMQARIDRSAGVDTAGFVSGYRGSPLGTLDRELWSARSILAADRVTFEPGLNEDLAATAVWGTQQVGLSTGAKHDGVYAMWYAKSPGVDRSGDVLKHANAAGTAPMGGVLAIAGDDHACKSASLPSQSDYSFLDASIPVLHPADVGEVIRFGLIGVAMSRACGLWVGMKALADMMDSATSVELSAVTPKICTPDDMPSDVSIRWPDTPLDQETRLFDVRLPAALRFARANGVNRMVADSPSRRLLILAVGKSRIDVMQALALLGLDAAAIRNSGIAVAAVGMAWPLDPDFALQVCRGATEVLVVEEKRPLVEDQLARILFNLVADSRPRLVGKTTENGEPLLTAKAAYSADDLAFVIAARLAGLDIDVPRAMRPVTAEPPPLMGRSPFFCSGCPHNRSTTVPQGSRALAGIGCHYMAQWMDRETTTFTQMGGEGASWIGQAPFTETGHIFVNLGDGTYAHSGVLAIRAAVAAGITITYKLLFNDAVAMTGGQPAEGNFTVEQIVAQVAAEGVAAVRIVAEEPDRFAGAPLPRGTTVSPRADLDRVQRELRETKGVSVLVYDQVCAAEKRRRRKRGEAPPPRTHVIINEDVCEGCGDCGRASNCVSLIPVETHFGRKRRVDQSSCNHDVSCVDGFCPSFVTVEGGVRKPDGRLQDIKPPQVPEPTITVPPTTSLIIGGIGGTGVVTVGALIGMAAHLDGSGVSVMDQIGLSQKGGEVTSHVRLAPDPGALGPARLSTGDADTLIGCDLVVAATPAVLRLLAASAVAIVNDAVVMPGEFTTDPDRVFPGAEMVGRIAERVPTTTHDLTRIATVLLGDAMFANVMALGLAWQRGRVPVSLAALRSAITLNGVAVEQNTASFEWGRALADDPSAVMASIGGLEDDDPPTGLDEIVARRVDHLVRYQEQRLADRYAALVERVWAAEVRVDGSSTDLARAVAVTYHRLLAIKDEYEVARLYTQTGFVEHHKSRFEGGKVYFHFATPLFARTDAVTGQPLKRRIGTWIMPVLRALAAMRRLRGTTFDIFGRTAERRLERRLIVDYEGIVDRLLAELDAGNLRRAVVIASVHGTVRGYGHVKDRSIRDAQAEVSELMAHWPVPAAPAKAAAE